MPLSSPTEREGHYIYYLSILPSVCYQTCEHNVLKTTNELILHELAQVVNRARA